MRKRKYLLWLIFLVTLVAIIINLPKRYRPFRFLQSYDLVKGLDLAGGVQLMFLADMEEISSDDKDQALEALKKNIERRVDYFGVSETIVQTSRVGEEYRLIAELPGIVDVDQAVDLIGRTAQLEFRERVELEPEATESATLNDVFRKKTDLTGGHLIRSEVQFNPNTGQPEVGLEFNKEGGDLFAEITEANIGEPLAIFLDDQLVSAPRVNEKITGGKASISGDFDLEQAKQLSSQLNAGALPVSIELIERRQIGPSLGQESLEKSFRAGLVGLSAVILFMIAYYRWLGLIAVLGLIIYGLITLTLYKLIPVTLTLPGITGFLISIGMAVDSNILIFERIKEETKDGRSWNAAMELSFGRGWDAIRDADICTLIISFLLFNPFDWVFLNSSSAVRGFAVTLALGIFVGLFTEFIITRELLRVFARRKK